MSEVRFGLLGHGRRGPVVAQALRNLAGRARLSVIGTRKPLGYSIVGVDHVHGPGALEGVLAASDAVYVATPPASHEALARACLEAGKPTVVEKPLTITSQDARALVALAEARRVPLWVVHGMAWDARHLAIRAAITDAHADVTRVYAEAGDYGPPGADALWDWMPHPLAAALDFLPYASLTRAHHWPLAGGRGVVTMHLGGGGAMGAPLGLLFGGSGLLEKRAGVLVETTQGAYYWTRRQPYAWHFPADAPQPVSIPADPDHPGALEASLAAFLDALEGPEALRLDAARRARAAVHVVELLEQAQGATA